jgi:hypothetical protein
MLTHNFWVIARSSLIVILVRLKVESRSFSIFTWRLRWPLGGEEILRGPLVTRLAQGHQGASRFGVFRQRQTATFQN